MWSGCPLLFVYGNRVYQIRSGRPLLFVYTCRTYQCEAGARSRLRMKIAPVKVEAVAHCCLRMTEADARYSKVNESKSKIPFNCNAWQRKSGPGALRPGAMGRTKC